nr:putative ribonuclease H-like domain-containing protein [Tanacetum cinerariifolium]
PNIAGSGPTWLFYIDSLTRTINYQPVTAGNQSNPSAGFQDKFDAEKAEEEVTQQYLLFPVWSSGSSNPQNKDGDAAFDGKEHEVDTKKPESAVNVSPSSSAQSRKQDDKTKKKAKGKSSVESFTGNRDLSTEFEDHSDNNNNDINAVGSISLTTQTTSMTRVIKEQGGLLQIFNDDFHTCMFACFLSQEEPKRVHQALKDPSWIEAMQEELLQFKIQKVCILVDLPHGKRAIGTKWVYRNKKDERDIVVRNKARIVVQGHSQEEGIEYEKVFAPVARIEAIRISTTGGCQFLGCRLISWQCKKQTVVATSSIEADAFLYGTIEEEVYVCQPPGFEDPDHPDKVYKLVKALYGLHQAPKAWYETLANYLLENGFHRGQIDQTLFIKKQKGDILLMQIYVDDIIFGATNKDLCKSFEKLMKDKFQMKSMGELTFFLGLQVKQKEDGIFINQDKYIAEILKKFRLTKGKSASTPIDTEKPLLKDPNGEDVDLHIYRSMIGSLMYLTSSRPDIMFVVCACYPKDSPFDLVAYSDSDYAGASLDRKSTTGGGQFHGCRLIFWQCKKQTVVATSSIEAEYLAAASCCTQVIWIQNQLLDYGYIKYALTVNPTIYVTCIKQFWNTVVIKQSNDVTRLQALVDRLKMVIIEAAIRDVLRLDDADGVDCLPNEEIFAELAHIGRKLNFSKYIFESLVRNVDSGSKFYMYPRVGKGWAETPLFEGMLVAGEIEEQGDDVQDQAIPSPTPLTPPPQQPQDLPSTSQATDFPMSLFIEALDACFALTRRVEHLEYDKVAQALEITKLKKRVKKLERNNKVNVLKLRRLKKVGTSQRIKSSANTDMEDASNQGRMIADLDRDTGVALMDDEGTEDEQEVKEAVDVVTTAKLIIEVVAAVSKSVTAARATNADVPAATITDAPVRVAVTSTKRRKGVVIKDPEEESTAKIPVETKSKDKGKGIVEQIEEEENKAIESINETLSQNAAKRRKLNEEVEDLKQHLEIVPDEDDDVYTEATSLARKVPVVDYQIIQLNNKPRYKIIRADGTHQLYVSFITLLKNFDREDLESL